MRPAELVCINSGAAREQGRGALVMLEGEGNEAWWV